MRAMMVKCVVCSQTFSRREKRIRACSSACGRVLQERHFENMRRNATTICPQCHASFVRKHNEQQYCSHGCHAKFTKLGGDNYHVLAAYYASGKPNGRFSTVGKGMMCRQCDKKFDVPPHKVREGKAIFCSQRCYDQHRYNPSLAEDQRQRNSPMCRQWKRRVFERDSYTCGQCGQHGGRLVAHHVQRWSTRPELRFEISNGLTLCYDCHEREHGRTRRKANTDKDMPLLWEA